MNRAERQSRLERALAHMKKNRETDLALYSENMIVVPAESRWDYAIPENYTNYHDGFIWQDEEPYRGMPMIRYKGKTLYLHRAIRFGYLDKGEEEKLLLFDRHGSKYTFVVLRQEDESLANPSYFRFLPKVKKYERSRKCTLKKEDA